MDIDYDKLVESLVRNNEFKKLLLSAISKNVGNPAVKAEIQAAAAEIRNKYIEETNFATRKWYEDYFRQELQTARERTTQKMKDMLDFEMAQVFNRIAKQEIEELLRKRFADVEVKFTIGSLFQAENPVDSDY